MENDKRNTLYQAGYDGYKSDDSVYDSDEYDSEGHLVEIHSENFWHTTGKKHAKFDQEEEE